MEQSMRRKRVFVTECVGKVTDEEYEKYKLQTRGEYEDLMMEFEFRCRRAAMMHYYEASGYDRKMYYMECLSALIGSVSCTSVGAWLLQNQNFSLTSLSMTSLINKGSLNPNSLGSLGAFGIGVVFVLQLLGKGSMKILPSFSRRQHLHVTAAAAWQKLAMKTRSYRIQLDNPKLDVDTYAKWYLDVITNREKLCTVVAVPEATYRLYSDPRRVMGVMKNRRLMYLKYLQLEDVDKEDMVDIDVGGWDARWKMAARDL